VIDSEPQNRGGRRIDPWRSRLPRRAQHSFSRLRDVTEEQRREIADRLLHISVIGGGILLVPTIAFAFFGGKTAFAIAGSCAYLFLVALRIASPLRFKALGAALVTIFFALGAFLIAEGEVYSSGAAWLVSSASLATVFFGFRGGLATAGAQALAMLCVCALRFTGVALGTSGFVPYIVASANSVGLSLLVSLAQANLAGGMARSIASRGRLARDLSARQAELAREAAGRRDAESRAVFLESHDPLTRLMNRDSFELSLCRAIEAAEGRGKILGVMSIGIDRFARIGQAHGPGAADAILIEAAARLARSFRDGDLVARTENDVFLVLLADVKDPDDARAIIDKTRQAFDRSFSVEGSEIGLSASFGLSLFPGDCRKATDLIRASEVALHLAKDDGPGSFRLYDAKLHARIIERGLIEQELRGALREGAFLPWFQPKVDFSGRIVGAEALARWVLPQGGFRQPSDFIQAAEKAGYIGDLGRLVLYKSCSSAAAWERAGLDPIPVSVNLSPYQFRSDDLVKDVRGILSSTGLSASRLDLEITESGIMDADGDAAIEKLAELKALGCSISIDDFGTGYSSFSALRDFPVDCVKLPQSFVAPLPDDPRASAIASAVIDLAHRLRFSVVAEGVENADQFAWLGAARCDQYQGFLFSPPIPAGEFSDALARGLVAAVE
jgi:diguanylate cyclase (GGDEF)-like protein